MLLDSIALDRFRGFLQETQHDYRGENEFERLLRSMGDEEWKSSGRISAGQFEKYFYSVSNSISDGHRMAIY